MVDTVQDVLKARGLKYGRFQDNAIVSQAIKSTLFGTLRAKKTRPDHDMLEALDMIAHKLARIVCGDSNYQDSWVDIAGYAMLVADRLENDKQPS